MKKISVIIAVAAVSAFFAVTGCEKQEAPKPVAVESTTTSTAAASAPTSTPTVTAAPAAK